MDIDPADAILNAGCQPEFISAYVEDGELSDGIRMWVGLSYIHEVAPTKSLSCPVPVIKGCLRFGVAVRELSQRFPADDAHG
jgi:hypothetical protein